MIPKDAYVFICFDREGKDQIYYPYLDNISDPFNYRKEPEYIFDYKDAEKYISESLAGKYERILIAKVVDLVTAQVCSLYKEKQ